ncbi:MAG: four helix bundle protein [Planctomycetota bacterium]
MCSYRQLLLWQQASALTRRIYQATQGLDTDDHFELAASLRKEALTVAVHIATDYSSEATEFLQGLERARRALVCLEHLVYLAQALGYWPLSRTVGITRQLVLIRRHVQAFFHSLPSTERRCR